MIYILPGVSVSHRLHKSTVWFRYSIGMSGFPNTYYCNSCLSILLIVYNSISHHRLKHIAGPLCICCRNPWFCSLLAQRYFLPWKMKTVRKLSPAQKQSSETESIKLKDISYFPLECISPARPIGIVIAPACKYT
jgi:hypothetical protein